MDLSAQDKAKIVAFARLLGKAGSDKDILEEYDTAYEAALKAFLAEPPKSGEAVVFKNPFSR